jgi:hypothetical protein
MNNRAVRLNPAFARPPDDPGIATIRADPDGVHIWRSITARIRGGDTDAIADFHAEYSGGVRLLLRRRTGPVPAERLIDGVLRGAVEEIKRGWIRIPRDLLFFVQSVVKRQIQLDPRGPLPAASEWFRIQQKARRLEQAMASLLPAEREAMIRYYLDGCSLQQVAGETGLDLAALLKLRSQLRKAVNDPTEPVVAEVR